MEEKEEQLLKVRGLKKSYDGHVAVDDVDFRIPQGCISGLVGPNGAGKTTIIKCMIGFLDYDGEIKLKYDGKEKKDNALIGYLAEDEGYYPSWTGGEYLEYFAELYQVEDFHSKVSEKLKTVGLYGRKDDEIREYSNGMKKRLGIARTLLHDPKLLIYDEPLSGLDPTIKNELMRIIDSIAGGENSVLISSHQLNDIEESCNWIVMIEEGKIRDFGEPSKVLERTGSSKKLVLNIEKKDMDKVKELDEQSYVRRIKVRGRTLVIETEGGKDVEKRIFNWLIKNDIDFSLKHGSLDSIYRGSFK